MNKKLTLSMDADMIAFAHQYANMTKQSISHLFEAYLRRLQSNVYQSEIASESAALYGIFEGKDVPDKHEMRKECHEKSNYRS